MSFISGNVQHCTCVKLQLLGVEAALVRPTGGLPTKSLLICYILYSFTSYSNLGPLPGARIPGDHSEITDFKMQK